jgi:hypothetical protein
MLAMLGTLNVIDGIAAISNSSFYTENARFVFSDLNTFGWIVLVLGSVQVLAAFGIWAKTPGVRWFGVIVASLNAIAQLLWMPAYRVLVPDAVHAGHPGDLRARRLRQAFARLIRFVTTPRSTVAANDESSPRSRRLA